MIPLSSNNFFLMYMHQYSLHWLLASLKTIFTKFAKPILKWSSRAKLNIHHSPPQAPTLANTSLPLLLFFKRQKTWLREQDASFQLIPPSPRANLCHRLDDSSKEHSRWYNTNWEIQLDNQVCEGAERIRDLFLIANLYPYTSSSPH